MKFTLIFWRDTKKIGKTHIYVNLIIGKDTTVVDTRYFRVKNIPAPIVTCATKNGGYIQKKVILATTGLQSRIVDFETFHSGIKSFTMIVLREDKVIASTHNKSYRFTNESKEVLSKTKINDKIIFANIIGVIENQGHKQFQTVEFIIK